MQSFHPGSDCICLYVLCMLESKMSPRPRRERFYTGGQACSECFGKTDSTCTPSRFIGLRAYLSKFNISSTFAEELHDRSICSTFVICCFIGIVRVTSETKNTWLKRSEGSGFQEGLTLWWLFCLGGLGVGVLLWQEKGCMWMNHLLELIAGLHLERMWH